MKTRHILLSVLAVLLFCACEKPNDGKTTYTLTNRLTDAYKITATIYEYNAADQRVDSNILVVPEVGKAYTFEANDSATHVKVKLTSEENTVRWGKTIITLTPHEDTPITVGLGMLANYSLTEPML